ncbi:glycoside hydrolase family 127 protein [Cyclobacterium salsum]|uniref:glycoside hydrolase family 127 protein n=1 Tax=Cyclobacterium salsum TaxID=2666329 RepID=UPI001391891B|nr:beta-L-arabinofuranosidase domain-containing protein [Cyclobacterium salsum]
MIIKNLPNWIFIGIIAGISCTEMPSSDVLPGYQPTYLEAVSYRNVRINDDFWTPKIHRSRVNGLRSVFAEAESSLANFAIAAGIRQGQHNQMMASDSDVYKMIQGVAHALHHESDAELEAFSDQLIDTISAAQLPDGYLFTPHIAGDRTERWTDIDRDHELYCAGHLFEAAVAYYEVTGKRKLLDVAIRFADHIDSIFGPGKRREVPGHQEIELALYALYQTTGNEKYFRLATFFLDERGNPARIDTVPPKVDPYADTPLRWRHPFYRQDHLPVDRQYHARGHGVRAVYMYSAMADMEMETQSGRYLPALDSLWSDIVTKKMYVTAGIGTHEFRDEGFGSPYKLPNSSAYSETCSGIGFTLWSNRMGLLRGQSKYADLVEYLLYNAAISSVSMEGDRFFYRNLLASDGGYQRRPWFNPACCPSNMVRFLPAIGSLVYAKDKQGIYVNQFIGNEASLLVKDQPVSLRMESQFPWDGNVSLFVNPKEAAFFDLRIRIPGWSRGNFLPGSDLYVYADTLALDRVFPSIALNGAPLKDAILTNGYLLIQRTWQPGDQITLSFPMEARAVIGHPEIEDTNGKVALVRGPLVYCMEEVDNPDYFRDKENHRIHYKTLESAFERDLLEGVVAVTTRASNAKNEYLDLTYVPYHRWANRANGKMQVWARSE